MDFIVVTLALALYLAVAVGRIAYLDHHAHVADLDSTAIDHAIIRDGILWPWTVVDLAVHADIHKHNRAAAYVRGQNAARRVFEQIPHEHPADPEILTNALEAALADGDPLVSVTSRSYRRGFTDTVHAERAPTIAASGTLVGSRST